MEILKILQESAKDLISEDLDFFETELATGDHYDAAYQAQCRSKIKQIRKWMSGEVSSPNEDVPENGEGIVIIDGQEQPADQEEKSKGKKDKKPVSKGIIIDLDDVIPGSTNSAKPKISPVQQVMSDMNFLRNKTDYKSAFKKYAKTSTIIDADFLDKNFAIFDSWEMDVIVSVKQLGEEFLEKYFGAIDHDKIARYQLFSESFFMKHFAQMDASIVLEHGKNEWRKKENRSKQLDVFLRLKGVKI